MLQVCAGYVLHYTTYTITYVRTHKVPSTFPCGSYSNSIICNMHLPYTSVKTFQPVYVALCTATVHSAEMDMHSQCYTSDQQPEHCVLQYTELAPPDEVTTEGRKGSRRDEDSDLQSPTVTDIFCLYDCYISCNMKCLH